MGNPLVAVAPAPAGAAPIHHFYSQNTWIEGAAVDQLHQVACLAGVRRVAAFPDLHPGKHGPVGCAVLADRIYPHLIGNDIGCGMSLFALGKPARKLRLDKVAQKLRALEGPWTGDANQYLRNAGLPSGLEGQALGTLGGGNHFCELQCVGAVYDDATLAASGMTKDDALLLVHSGSRSLGTDVFNRVFDQHHGLEPTTQQAQAYMQAHDQAVVWARVNRQVIALRAADALRADIRLLADSPHNLIELRDDGYLHRKGAAKADGTLVPIAGSRDAPSFLVKPCGNLAESLSSLAHGSGRRYDRASMTGRAGKMKSDRERLQRTSFGGHVICDDRQLLIEEAPLAYKDPEQVMADLAAAGLAEKLAALHPLITFKKARDEERTMRRDKQSRLRDRRRGR